MKKIINTLMVMALAAMGARATMADTIYNSIPSPEPYNLPSLSYQATQTAEFGDEVTLAGTERQLGSVTVGLSSWALQSNYPGFGNAEGFTVPLTLNIYNVGAGNAPGDQPGTLLTTQSITAFVPWCPQYTVPDASYPGGYYGWTASDGNVYHGLFSNVTFDFSQLDVTLPNTIIIGLAFNTQSWGNSPTGIEGPYNSLNFAIASSPPSVGSEVTPGTLFWNTEYSGYGGNGTFQATTEGEGGDWSGSVPAVEITAVPLPASAGVGLSMLAGLGAMFAMRKRLSRRARVA